MYVYVYDYIYIYICINKYTCMYIYIHILTPDKFNLCENKRTSDLIDTVQLALVSYLFSKLRVLSVGVKKNCLLRSYLSDAVCI